MKPSQAKQYLTQLQEFKADPATLMSELEVVRKMAIDGYKTEKATAKGEVVEVFETDLRTAVAAIKETRELVKTLIVIAGDEIGDSRDYQFQLTVVTKPATPKLSSGADDI
jgi:hypothetical protein